VFLDLDYLLVVDSGSPNRFLALGFSRAARVLVVVHVERAERVRIISARVATKLEADTYGKRKAVT